MASFLLAATTTRAQTRTAAVEGVVRDAAGAALPSPTVTLLNAETNQEVVTTGDQQGLFRFAGVPVGTYELRIDYPGFASYRHGGLVLLVGQTAHLSIELQLASVAETVTVHAQPPPMDPRQTAVTTSVDTERIEELPVRSRNYLEFALLAPGVTRSSAIAIGAGSSAAIPDSGFSFGGLRPRSNTLNIDGLDNSDEVTGGSRTELSLEAVREFQVVNNGWSAENGGAAGGSINVVTKSGLNTIHGDAFVFGESGALNARPKLESADGPRPDLTRARAGLAIGGPLRRDRLFYFGALEQEHTDGEQGNAIDAEARRSIDLTLATPPFQGLHVHQLTPGLVPTARRETEWSMKVDHQLEARSSLQLRVAGNDSRDESTAFNTGGVVDASAFGSRQVRDIGATGAWNTAWTPHLINEVRAQIARRQLELTTPELAGSGVVISGVAEFGTPYAGNSTHRATYVDASDVLGLVLGRHELKIGGGVRHVDLNGVAPDGREGLYVFRTLADFESGQPDSFRQRFGAFDVRLSGWRVNAFIEDHVRWTPQLTVDLGLRTDATDLGPSLGFDVLQLSPRAGIAWMPTAEWVIRGGIGEFGDRIALASVDRAWSARQGAFEQILDSRQAAALLSRTLGGPLTTPLESIPPSTDTVRQGTWRPRSRQLSIGVERQLTPNLTVSVNYLDVHGRELARTVNVNLVDPVLITGDVASSGAFVPQQVGRAVFGPGRLDPAHDAISELQPTASSSYHALTATANRRLADEIEWTVAYTWARATDSASDFDEQPQNPFALDEEWSASRYDDRHRLVASAVFDIPIGDEDATRPVTGWLRALTHLSLAPLVTLTSGRPVNVTTGADDNRTGAWPLASRPLGMPRNAARLPASATLDLRLLKYFEIKPHGKLDLVVEAFNLFNRTNLSAINSVYGPGLAPLASYRQPIAAASARQIQFSIDFEF